MSAVAAHLELRKHAPDAYRALAGVERALAAGELPHALRELVKLRASQLNGCAYCLRTHAVAARAAGVPEVQLDVLAAWRESGDVFDTRERAALGLAEALTLVADGAAPDAVAEARTVLDEAEIVALVFTVATINTWNRLHVAAGTEVPA